jgi:hypothetical protein
MIEKEINKEKKKEIGKGKAHLVVAHGGMHRCARAPCPLVLALSDCLLPACTYVRLQEGGEE